MPVDTVSCEGYRRGSKTVSGLSKRLLLHAEDLLVGQSRAIQAVHQRIHEAATRKHPVLIQGPTGSGKELVARALHLESRRSGRLVPVNVAAIAEGVFETELFGHVRGAFTGALHQRKGLFRSAAGGTLFLDEIGELSLPLQAKLLRVLDTYEVWPVGADEGENVDVRIIAATNADLEGMVKGKAFRRDLLYRLQAVHIDIPPLEDRVEDIPLLADHFAGLIANEYTETQMVFSPTAVGLLQRHAWPGNVRELRDVVERLAMQDTPLITEIQVKNVLRVTHRGITPSVKVVSQNVCDRDERAHLEELLEIHNGCIAQVAAALDLVPSSVYRRMRRYGIRVGPRGRKRRICV